MASSILFVNIPARGHVFPTLAVVAELTARGHAVTYVTVDEFADTVRATGAEVLTYPSVNPLELVGKPESGGAPAVFLRENIAMLKAIEAHYGAGRPDVVVYDEAAFQAGRVLARKWGRPAVQSTPSFAFNEHFSFIAKMLEGAEGFTLTDPVAETEALLTAHGLAGPLDDFLWTRRGPEKRNIVYLTRDFQYEGQTFDDRFAFVGPCLGERNFLGDWTPPGDGRPLALVSLGTVHNGNLDFFRAGVEAFAGLEWHAVMSVGDKVDIADLGPLPANVEIHRWVPHRQVLDQASVFITHGGTGSVMESLLAGVPLVVVPQWLDVEPNAARIAELGLGRLIPPDEYDAERLRTTLRELSADAGLPSRMEAMRQHTAGAGGTRRAADVIEAETSPTR
ncbi:macrolide family glycosyltransferase [Streptomyces sp. NPDC046465]|uniref:macrolide family glycosyltransferase n=1 Tax=Streptomyces sp. NPDC046465 TaxID=3155810 RepID=UPI003404331D